jgi:hypothetical protein
MEDNFQSDDEWPTRLDLLRTVYENNREILETIRTATSAIALADELAAFDGWMIGVEIGPVIGKPTWEVKEDHDGEETTGSERVMNLDRLYAANLMRHSAKLVVATLEEIATVEAEAGAHG